VRAARLLPRLTAIDSAAQEPGGSSLEGDVGQNCRSNKQGAHYALVRFGSLEEEIRAICDAGGDCVREEDAWTCLRGGGRMGWWPKEHSLLPVPFFSCD
jgi:hypothetical protein